MQNKIHYRGEFIYIYMPHLTEEAELIMKNLYTFLKYQHGDDIDLYFIDTAKKKVEEDK